MAKGKMPPWVGGDDTKVPMKGKAAKGKPPAKGKAKGKMPPMKGKAK